MLDYLIINANLPNGQTGMAVGVQGGKIVAIEKGHYAPSLEAAFRIARAFGADIEEVFGYSD